MRCGSAVIPVGVRVRFWVSICGKYVWRDGIVWRVGLGGKERSRARGWRVMESRVKSIDVWSRQLVMDKMCGNDHRVWGYK